MVDTHTGIYKQKGLIIPTNDAIVSPTTKPNTPTVAMETPSPAPIKTTQSPSRDMILNTMTTPLSQSPYMSQELLYGPHGPPVDIQQQQHNTTTYATSPLQLPVVENTTKLTAKDAPPQELYVSPPLTAQNSTLAPQDILYLPPPPKPVTRQQNTYLPPPPSPLPASNPPPTGGKVPIAMPYGANPPPVQQKTANPYLPATSSSQAPPASTGGKVPSAIPYGANPPPVQQKTDNPYLPATSSSQAPPAFTGGTVPSAIPYGAVDATSVQNTTNPYLPTPSPNKKIDNTSDDVVKVPSKILVIVPTKNAGDGENRPKIPVVIIFPKLLNETTSAGNDGTPSAVNKPVQDLKQTG